MMYKYTHNALLYQAAVVSVSRQVVGGDMEIVTKYLELNVRHKAFTFLNPEDGQFAEIIALYLELGGHFLLGQFSALARLEDLITNQASL